LGANSANKEQLYVRASDAKLESAAYEVASAGFVRKKTWKKDSIFV
jgi:hypothetical protein